MTTMLALEYPNGRIHELALAANVGPGQEFDLFGRHWTVIGRVSRGRERQRRVAENERLLCRSTKA